MEIIIVIAFFAIILFYQLSKVLLKYSLIISLILAILFCSLIKECGSLLDDSNGGGNRTSCEAEPVGCSQVTP